jgi:hypothetical protein
MPEYQRSQLQIMGDGVNQDSFQDNARTVNHGQTNPKQALR